jgi:ADP-heptose:LPS heptosyltransferase
VKLSAEDVEWARKTKDELGEDLVLLFPQTAWEPRAWPSCYWVDLAWQLQNRNVPTAVFLGHEDKRYTGAPRYFWGFPFGRVAALMSLSAMVIGVDSGPAHISGTLGIPTLVMSGPTRPECVFGHLPEVTSLASYDDPGCTGCHFKPPFRSACDQGCQMLYSLKPHVVLAEVVSRLAVRRREKQGPAVT